MEEQNNQKKRFLHSNRWAGLLFLLVGGVLLLRQTGYPFPHWLFSWETILILVGLFIGIRHRFKDFSWLIMILVGAVFVCGDNLAVLQNGPNADTVIVIGVGVFLVV